MAKLNETFDEFLSYNGRKQTNADTLRMRFTRKLNANPRSREQLEALFGDVYDTKQLTKLFTVQSFLAPFILVTEDATGEDDILVFQHSPRFCWRPANDREALDILLIIEGREDEIQQEFNFTEWLEK